MLTLDGALPGQAMIDSLKKLQEQGLIPASTTQPAVPAATTPDSISPSLQPLPSAAPAKSPVLAIGIGVGVLLAGGLAYKLLSKKKI